MNNAFKNVVLGVGLLLTGPTVASDFTLNIHKEIAAGDNQFCYTDFEVDLDGNWTAKSMYSNGQQWNPVRFYSVTTVKSKDGREIITIPQNHHVRGSHGGSAREERTMVSGKLPQSVVGMVSKNNTSYSCQIVSDINFRNLQKIVEVAQWVLSL